MSVVDWHDLECGGYVEDLPLWRELAAGAEMVLDVGAGTGRVALDLAAHGTPVTALDNDPELLAALRERAGEKPVETVLADARDFSLPRRFPLILAPMQTVQLLGGAPGRAAFLERAAAHLEPGGRLAAALADPLEDWDAESAALPLPDVSRLEGVVITSQPVGISEAPAGWTIDRLRRVSAPGRPAELSHDAILIERIDADGLEAEGAAAGLRPAGRRRVPETAEYVGSEVVILVRG